MASEGTGRYDIAGKRADYAAFGIPEYWRFDPSGGQYHGVPLAGDRLADKTHLWGRSEALGLDLCWEEGRLQWYDPVARHYLLTFDESEEARIAAEVQVQELEAEIRRLRE